MKGCESMADSNTLGGIHYEMMRRCYNEKSIAYNTYGGKGIKVCDEWHDRDTFKKWCRENGWVKGLRLERIDTSKGYYPENCRFGIEHLKRKDSGAQITKSKRVKRQQVIKECGVPDGYMHLRVYSIYRSMNNRCYRKNNNAYKNYGARGIKICSEWSGKFGFMYFYKWAMENGYNDNLSIDRIDNDKGYSPDNCRWATIQEQALNKRNVIVVVYKGEVMSLSVFAKRNNMQFNKAKHLIQSLDKEDGVYHISDKDFENI